jgi:HPt (histidine-containing phosphotransfer) domain-containing protein
MLGNLILFFVAATLIVIIVAMLRQRGGPDVVRQQPRTPADVWLGDPARAPQAAKVLAPPPARDHEAMARDVMTYLRTLEDRGSPGLTAQVMPVFLRDTSSRLDALTEAVAQNDGTSAYRIAHTLHGSAATVGAASMVSTCADLIREVRCGAFDRCDNLIAELTLDFEAIRRAADALDVRHGN